MQLKQSQKWVPCIRTPMRQISQHLTLQEICLSTGAEVFGGTQPNGPFQRNTRNLLVLDVSPKLWLDKLIVNFVRKNALSRNCWKLKNIEKAIFAQIGTNSQTEPIIGQTELVKAAMQVSELKLEATRTLLKEIRNNGFNISSNIIFVRRPERRFLEAPSQTGPASEIYATCSSQIWTRIVI